MTIIVLHLLLVPAFFIGVYFLFRLAFSGPTDTVKLIHHENDCGFDAELTTWKLRPKRCGCIFQSDIYDGEVKTVKNAHEFLRGNK